MNEKCPFEEECYLSPDMVPITGVCDSGEPARLCGSAATYGLVINMFYGMLVEDSVNPIIGSFEVISEPRFEAVQDTQLATEMIGVVFPVRDEEENFVDPSIVTVSDQDLLLSMLAHGRTYLPFQGVDYRLRQKGKSNFVLPQNCGELKIVQSITSRDFYGQFIKPETRTQLDTQMFLPEDSSSFTINPDIT